MARDDLPGGALPMQIFFVETLAGEQRQLLCRWVEHFYEEGRTVHVMTESTLAAQHLDELLWTFSQQSFVPHRILSSAHTGPVSEPVIITTVEASMDGFDVLVFDGPMKLDPVDGYAAAVHFILRDDAERLQESRLLWQTARDRGFRTHHVSYSSNTKFPSLPV
jgi:DNA polymerase III subunit chi